MAHQLKMLVPKPDNLSSIPGTYMVVREIWLLQGVHCLPCVCVCVCVCACVYACACVCMHVLCASVCMCLYVEAKGHPCASSLGTSPTVFWVWGSHRNLGISSLAMVSLVIISPVLEMQEPTTHPAVTLCFRIKLSLQVPATSTVTHWAIPPALYTYKN
jgi:hypothetical protein